MKFAAKDYTVEVQLLENTDQSIHVSVAVDDGISPGILPPVELQFHPQETQGLSPSRKLLSAQLKPMP